ncbi:histidine phosphatase superfamily [Triangularia verruculosa]|uniref:Histidine phosphatase superfamily n=1 Tax=Triangularia verruculosa TaxID=2587418 RepID=A0AAN6XIB3_9PEZI|nr:histidine phosphatase superfamily [Triangularia verruculosa]
MPTYVHLVRHAQGFHNLSQANHILPDPDLTDLGKTQCEELYKAFPFHEKITHLVASPMRRTVYTCLLSFNPSASAAKPPIIALPDIQEVSPFPCDVGTEPEKLLSEFSDEKVVDLGLVKEGWNDKGPGSEYAPEPMKLHERARRAREWFRDLGRGYKGGEEEVNIVAVTHGGFLHFLTEDFEGVDYGRGTGWANTEWRTYEVVEEEGKGVVLKETGQSWKRRRGSAVGLTETEQMELRAAFAGAVEKEFGSGKY